MEIDLDNLVFNGLEEAQERNAERLDDADKKAESVIADDDCGDACAVLRGSSFNVFYFLCISVVSADFIPVHLAHPTVFSVLFDHETTPGQC